ncbi:serpin family protein [Cohnella sp. 56]|uniref:serpin family protein n=1 Tax=Cohnella sp. 56 TaxID=3113722 RepID=UPI0030E955A1
MDTKIKKRWYAGSAVILAGAIALTTALVLPATDGQRKVEATDLSGSFKPRPVNGKQADAVFTGSAADFAVDLFKKSYADNANTLVSPLSVMLALGMTAGGADGDTLAQMERTLGGGMPIAELDAYLHDYSAALQGDGGHSELSLGNSIWLRDDAERLAISPDFLQRTADYYGAPAYKAKFDERTVADINGWVSDRTKGMIPKILAEIPPEAQMYLINAVAFDADWERPYDSRNVHDGKFAAANGERRDVQMMNSAENVYVTDGHAVGFIRPYAGGRFSFAAVLPAAGTPIGTYVSSLTGASWLKLMDSEQSADVRASLPKFEYRDSHELKKTLAAFGMTDAFEPGRADFNRMGKAADGNLYISEVVHKTFISVDEKGTKAAAVTEVGIAATSARAVEPIVIELNRPFVYAIVDNATKLPVFIGALTDMAQLS